MTTCQAFASCAARAALLFVIVMATLGFAVCSATVVHAATTHSGNYDRVGGGDGLQQDARSRTADEEGHEAVAPHVGTPARGYDDAVNLARTSARPTRAAFAPQTTPTNVGGDCDGGVLYHGTGIEAARGIAANGFSVSAAQEMGGDGRYYVTERFGDAELFANSNPRFGEPGGEPAIVRADVSVSIEQALASGLLRSEPLPGAYTVANIPGFEAITRYSVIAL